MSPTFLKRQVIYKRGSDEDGTSVNAQFSVVGDTFLVGCALPDSCVFPEFNAGIRHHYNAHPNKDITHHAHYNAHPIKDITHHIN